MLGIVAMIAWQGFLVMRLNVHLENLRSENWEARLAGLDALVDMRDGGWEALSNQMLDVGDERSYWLRGGLTVGMVPEDSSEEFWAFHRPRFDKQFDNEAWAKRWLAERREKGVINSKLGGFWLDYPQAHMEQLQAGLDDPRSQREMVVELRRVTYQNFGFPWNGPADKQRAALEKWIAFLEELQREEYPEQLQWKQ